MYIYKITNIINNKIYIGKTEKTINKRMRDHINCSKRKRTYTSYLYNAMNEYGVENFKIEVIEECFDKENLNKREKFWIKALNSRDPNIGYNIQEGGEGGSLRSKEYKSSQKQLDALDKGRHLPASEKLKKKLSEYRKSVIVSDETREKLRKTSSGKKASEETKEKMRQSHLGLKMPERSDESKERYRQSSLNRVHIHKENINKNVFKDELDAYLNDGWELGYIYKK